MASQVSKITLSPDDGHIRSHCSCCHECRHSDRRQSHYYPIRLSRRDCRRLTGMFHNRCPDGRLSRTIREGGRRTECKGLTPLMIPNQLKSCFTIMAMPGPKLTKNPIKMITGVFIRKKLSLVLRLRRQGMVALLFIFIGPKWSYRRRYEFGRPSCNGL